METRRSYWRFGAMIATSVIVMFCLMYLNTYALAHIRWSETRVYMAFIMGAAMAVIMLSFMLHMYRDRRINWGIYGGAIVIFIVSLWLVRSQVTVADRSYMTAMIPHHSIAIMTSERAAIHDLRVQALAQEIISAQRREIKEMEWLIADIAHNGAATSQAEAEARPVPDFTGTSSSDQPSGSSATEG